MPEFESVRERWGDAIEAGFQVVPDVLLRYQAKLGLAPLDIVILLNVLLHWWSTKELPFPRLATVAARVGVSPRSIERRIVALEKRGFIRRLPPERQIDGITIRRFDLSGIVTELQNIARNDQAYEARRKRRDKVAA